ncbi:hypothetical protein FOA43_004116 [Brettanomyces nanus]|uniref:t-SNARE coiled-coil homology domain-containing protein n=1 Tax=Eeniella nana TaxID=13502 RepID=A0A875SAA1_EENNA|nr:uncharacterized protein FOA43_004116 [Brettanomyces nanus]QPG76722.1 hypothetical protein FOA43_004116 [Brettanomyces nanus]
MSFANYDIEAQNGTTQSVEESVVEVSPIFNEISGQLSEFISVVTRLDKMQRQLGTKRDNSQLRGHVSDFITRCDLLHNGINSSLRQLEKKGRGTNDTKLSFTESKLKVQCQEVFKNYQVILRSYHQRIQSVTVNEAFKKNEEELRRVVSESTPLLQEEGKIKLDEEVPRQVAQKQQNRSLSLSQVQQQQQQLGQHEVSYHEDLINERDEAITNISKGVQDINKIFQDLNEVVNQQGEEIDTIETGMNDYANNNQMAHHELRKADDYQKRKQNPNRN